MSFRLSVACVLLGLTVPASGNSWSPLGPSSTHTPPGAARSPSAVATIAGFVTDAATGAALSDVHITASQGNIAPVTKANRDGYYSFSGFMGRVHLYFHLNGYLRSVRTVTLDSDARVDVVMVPAFFQNGFGSAVLDLPVSLRYLRIQASVGDGCERFVVRRNDAVLVDVKIGSHCPLIHPRALTEVYYVYRKTGGALQIEAAPFVQWSVQQMDLDVK